MGSVKVIQAVGWYFPESLGGTEVYVSQLARELRRHGFDSVITAPRDGASASSYMHEGAEVFRYPVHANWSLQQVRGLSPHGGFEKFVGWLSDQDAEIYHQHSWTSGCGLHHLEAARKAGKRTIVTIHVPGPICMNGTMIRWGIEVCDGKIDVVKCSACSGIARGMPGSAAILMARTPLAVSRLVERRLSKSRLATAVAMPALAENHRYNLSRLAALSDRVIAVCQWLYDALAANGVSKEKLVLCRQGAFENGGIRFPRATYTNGNYDRPIVKVGYLGRWDRVKGIHILVQAVRRLPRSTGVELLIYAQAQDKEGEKYRDEISKIAEGDDRIRLLGPLGRDMIQPALAGMDILAVPSQWLETGPLVILEALAMGVPVLGSNLGGIAELVQHGQNGLLVAHSDVSAWSEALSMLVSNRLLIDKLRNGINPPRTVKTVADEMVLHYKSILES